MSNCTAQVKVLSEVLDMIGKCNICHKLSYTLIGEDDVVLMLRVPTCLVGKINAKASSVGIIMMQDHLLTQ